MTFVLMATCIFSPLNIAFSWHDGSLIAELTNHFIDLFYFADIVVIFNSAYMHDEL